MDNVVLGADSTTGMLGDKVFCGKITSKRTLGLKVMFASTGICPTVGKSGRLGQGQTPTLASLNNCCTALRLGPVVLKLDVRGNGDASCEDGN